MNQKEELSRYPSRAEVFERCFFKPDGSPTSNVVRDDVEKMKELSTQDPQVEYNGILHNKDDEFAKTKMDEMRRECQSEGAEPKSDVEIVQHVMKEKSSCNTYLATLGYSSTSKTPTSSSTSTTRILELEARLEQQEKEARGSNEKHEQELTSKFEAQQLENEELKRKQHEELDTVKKSQKDRSLEALEKKQHEMDTLLGYILRKQDIEPPDK